MRTFAALAAVLGACSSSSPGTGSAGSGSAAAVTGAGSAGSAGSGAAASGPCDAFADTMAHHVDDLAQRREIAAIAHKHCAAWPPETQRCAATTKDDDPDGQERCLAGVPPLDRAAMRDELADAIVDCSLVGELGPDAPTWAPLSGSTSAQAWTVNAIAERQCRDHAWSRDALRCLRRGTRDPRECIGDARAALDAALAPVFDLWTRAALTKLPSCEKMAAAYYSDAAWTAHQQPGSARAARAALVTACKRDDNWSPALRSCFALARTDRERLFCGEGVQWGYPPLELDPRPPNICPDAELAAGRGLMCNDLPADAWNREVAAIRAQRAAMSSATPPPCDASLHEVVARFAALGCKL